MSSIMWQARAEREDNAVEYEHRSKILQFPSSHAQANAAQAAMSLEEDREAVRRESRRAAIRVQIERYEMLIKALRVEDQLLEAPSNV